ncbi:MAG: type VI secretion system Vgr family protein [Comamonadaceae bacterium]|nr:type VI secretion system Vgr family protein [Comamonadaceae bacterium]
MRLACVPTPAELGIGALVAQRPGDTRRGSGRGSGFEATTAGWTSVRAARGCC